VNQRSGPVGVGIIGAGVISEQYLDSLTAFPDVKVVAIGDLFPAVAEARAAAYGVPVSGEVDRVLGRDDIDIVVNLTIPQVHAEVALSVIAAGKHVYNEKPIALDSNSAAELLQAAARANLRVGAAPDTFLGAGAQAVRRAVARGDIGEPQTALTLMQQPGPESWHPNPAFLFQRGAGPLFDIGPYYLTALIQLFGAVTEVAAISGKAQAARVVGSGPRAGETFTVDVPTHISAGLGFADGRSATSIYSFDSPLGRVLFEVTGTEATLGVPDPNNFGGDLLIRRREDEDWRILDSAKPVSGRGTGVLDLARAIREDRPHRASGALAAHVLDIMVGAIEAAENHRVATLTSTVESAQLLPDDWDPYLPTL